MPNEPADHDDVSSASPVTEPWTFRLYVAGRTPRGVKAFANLRRVCEASLGGTYHIEVVDLLQEPALAAAEQIMGVPAVVKVAPPPERRVIGDLSDTNRVLAGLGIEWRSVR